MVSYEELIAILSQVEEPALKKPIMQLATLKDIQLLGSQIAFTLDFKTPVIEDQIKKLITNKLKEHDPSIVQLNITINAPKKTKTAQDQKTKTSHIKYILAVASGKGGVGKSMFAFNLALALQKEGKKVGFLDADIYGPSTKKIAGLNAVPTIVDERIIPLTHHNIKIISSAYFNEDDQPLIMRGPVIASMVSQFITHVEWEELDYLILDFPPGTGDIQMTLCQTFNIDGAIIITTPQEVAALDAKKALRMFTTFEIPVLGTVENMSGFFCPDNNTTYKIFPGNAGEELAREEETILLGKIPLEPLVAEGMDTGLPLVLSEKTSAAKEKIKEITKKIMVKVEKEKEESREKEPSAQKTKINFSLEDDIPTITVDELNVIKQKEKNLIILDVRKEHERAYGTIEPNVWIPMHEIQDLHSELPKNQPIVVYCRSGGRSARVTDFLKKQGYKEVFNLKGGILAWKKYDPEIQLY